MKVPNRILYDAATALTMLAELKPKRGLFGFKYALAQRYLQKYVTPIGDGMNEILMRHVERDEKKEPVLHPSGRGFKLASVEAYEEDVKTLMDSEIEVADWPPVTFTSEDIDKAEIEIPNRAYHLLGSLLGGMPT